MVEKVKVKLLTNIVLNGYRKAGDVLEIDSIIANKLINSCMAAPIIEMSQPSLFDEGDCG